MNRRQLFISTITVIFIVMAIQTACALDLNKVREFTIPNITSVSDYIFGTSGIEGKPNILARSGNRLVLYSADEDSLLFDIVLPEARSYKIAYGDINRDNSAEIIVAMAFAVSGQSDSAGLINVYSPLGGEPLNQVYLSNSDFDTTGVIYVGSFGNLSIDGLLSADVDMDGYSNLVISYKTNLSFTTTMVSLEYKFFGKILVFNSYPTDTLALSKKYFENPRLVSGGCNPILVGRSRQFYTSLTIGPAPDGSYHETETVNCILYNSALNEFYTIGRAKYDGCGFSEDWRRKNLYNILLCANIEADNCAYELLSSYLYTTYCIREAPPFGGYNSGYLNECYSGYLMSETTFVTQEILPPETHSHYVFHPSYPGTFFAYIDGSFRQIDFTTEEAINYLPTLPTGISGWRYPFDDGIPYLVTLDANAIRLYEISDYTAADDDMPPLPGVFSIGPVKPNPFNARQTIPIRLEKERSQLQVSVYDILGRRVAVLFDGIWDKSTGELSWDAEAFSTGVYFIKAQSGSQSLVVKSVLLK